VGAAALAALIFGQIPSAMQLLGGALILGGLVWYSRMEGEAA
jgi:drug/metabolite transporter (DMT)-like permease